MSNVSDTEAFCTIITDNYIHYAFALHDSLKKHSESTRIFYVFVTSDPAKEKASLPCRENVQYLYIDELCKEAEGKAIFDKYFYLNTNSFRWSMKPVLLKYLIQHKNCDSVLFLDCDLYFFHNYDFLFEKLQVSDILLTPHWRSSDTEKEPENFDALIPHGLFNAGFVGINKNAVEAVEWWAKACEYACEIDAERGIYVDQGYLNALPVLFNNVEILKHQGCNVAEWNILDCRRVLDEDGNVLINSKFPVVFIHFTTRTVKRIADGRDPFLLKYLSEFVFNLFKYNKEYNILSKAALMEPDIIEKRVYVGVLNRIISKLHIGDKVRSLNKMICL